MADIIDKRVSDIEQVLAHLPEDLDARFAGVDVKLAAIREVQALHTTRFSKIEARFTELERKIDARFNEVDAKFAEVNYKLEQILNRLP